MMDTVDRIISGIFIVGFIVLLFCVIFRSAIRSFLLT